MADTKTATLPLWIDRNLKKALRTAARLEHLSITNMVEVLVRDWCERHGVAIPCSQ